MGILGRFLLDDDEPEAERPFALRAFRLGLRFEPRPQRLGRAALPPGDGRSLAEALRAGRVALVGSGGGSRLVIAPDEDEMQRLSAKIDRQPELRARLVVSTPDAIRRLLNGAASRRLLAEALGRLDHVDPAFSARRLLTPLQLAAIILVAILSAAAIMLHGFAAFAPLGLLADGLFLALIVMRMMALSLVLDRTAKPAPPPARPDPARLPVYTILLPLYDEAHMVGELVRAMNRLDWPRERLDIKFLVEARDRATAAAIERLDLRAPFEVVIVPDALPRTKPKALAYAMPLMRGDFVTVYDAEDRPDPGQLLEAFSAFEAGGERLACVQAPLLIDNGDANGLTGLFAMEYAALFDGLLPLLAAFDLPLPLGGTSNHFRRSALERIGGWDPYNVTEDADIGIRLARFGLAARMITRPTYEEAPLTSRLWLSQRTRWLKGWMQTFLVHTRHPVRLWREIGTFRLAGFLLTSFGSVLAAAVYPIYLLTALLLIIDPALLWRASSPLVAGFVMLNLFNFVAAYLVFSLLAGAAYRQRGRRRPAGALIFLPAYWLLLSLACYRALFELVIAPHRWAKTPHVGRQRALRRAQRRPAPPPGAVGTAPPA